MDEKQAQALYAEFMQVQEQVNALKTHFEQIQEQLRNIERTKETLQELEKIKQETLAWVPIAPGAYVHAKLQKPDSVLLNIGADVAVEKKPEDLGATLAEHENALQQLAQAALQELKQSLGKLEAIRKDVEAH